MKKSELNKMKKLYSRGSESTIYLKDNYLYKLYITLSASKTKSIWLQKIIEKKYIPGTVIPVEIDFIETGRLVVKSKYYDGYKDLADVLYELPTDIRFDLIWKLIKNFNNLIEEELIYHDIHSSNIIINKKLRSDLMKKDRELSLIIDMDSAIPFSEINIEEINDYFDVINKRLFYLLISIYIGKDFTVNTYYNSKEMYGYLSDFIKNKNLCSLYKVVFENKRKDIINFEEYIHVFDESSNKKQLLLKK